MNDKKKNNKISTYIVNKREENKKYNKKQMQIIPDFSNPYLNDFSTYPGTGWIKKQGTPTYNTTTGVWDCTFTYTFSNWYQDGFANDGTTGSARMNIYSTWPDEWLISPVFNLNNGFFLVSCDAAATEYNATIDAIWGTDDWAALFMTSDGGSTWIELYRWDASNNPGANGASTGDISIEGYNNIDYTNVQFGFYAESTQPNEDIDFFIDNFRVKKLANAYGDEDGGPITGTVDPHNSLAILTPPTNGNATIGTNGNWSYTPNQNFNGLDSFTITIDGYSEYKELRIYVKPINDLATITGDISGIYRGQPVTGQLTVIDNNDGFTNANRFSIVTNGAKGNASVDYTGNWTYTPNANFMDTDTFIIRITDDDNHIENRTITIIGAVSGDRTGVIDEDSGPITGMLTINSAYFATHNITNSDPFSITTDPTNGTATINSQGNWSYTPSEHFYGTDTFIVTLTEDDGNTQTRTITITVNSINDLATITGDISGFYNSQPVTGRLIVTDVDGFTNNNRFSISIGNDVLFSSIHLQNTFSNGAKPDGWNISATTGDGWRFTGNPGYDASTTGSYNNKSQGTFAWVDFSLDDVNAILQTNTNPLPVGYLVIKFDFFSFNATYTSFTTYNELYLEIEDEDGNWVIIGDPLADNEDSPFKRKTYSDRENLIGGWETIYVSYYNNNPNANLRFRAESGGLYNDYVNDLLISDLTVGFPTITIDYDGNWTYTPNTDFDSIGTDTFTVIIKDNVGNKTLQDITITGVLLGDFTGVVDEDSGPITGKLNINPAIQNVTNSEPFSVHQNPINGTATIDNQGNWSYTPREHFYGTDTFIVIFTDDESQTKNATITITVNPINDPPTITGDISGFYMGQQVTGQLIVDDIDGFTNDNRFSISAEFDNGAHQYITLNYTSQNSQQPPADNSNLGDPIIYTTSINEDSTSFANNNLNDYFRIRWETYIKIPESGTYYFKTTSDDGQILTVKENDINGTILGSINDWISHPSTTKSTDAISLEKGSIVWVRYDYYEHGGGASARLFWNKNGVEETIPIEVMYLEKPVHKYATIDNDGNWTYTPDENFDETDTFTVIITDDFGSKTLQDITITKLISVKPYIISSNRADSIMEYSGANQIIYKAFADDPDSPISDLTFLIDESKDLSIDSESGEVTLIPNPVYDKDNSKYIFNVYAKDKDGNTSYAKTVTLNILPASITLKQPNTEDGMPQDDIIIPVVKRGWKLIGTTTESILLNNNLIVPNSIYMLKDGYETISEADGGYPLQANKGYWIRFDW